MRLGRTISWKCHPHESDSFHLYSQAQSNRYKTSLMKPATRALSASSKVSVRTDPRGFLSMQYMVLNEDGQVCFVEYLCTPDEELRDGGQPVEDAYS